MSKTVSRWSESEGVTWESKMSLKPRNESDLILCMCKRQTHQGHWQR